MGFSPTLSVTILYAPWVDWREAAAKDAFEQLQADDDIQHVELHEAERRPVWENSKRCWREAESFDSTHHLHTMGDIEVCDHFGEAAINALSAVPNKPVCFHQRQQRLTKYYEQGFNWVLHPDGGWGIGTCLPEMFIDEMLEFGERYYVDAEEFGSYDRRLCGWLLYEYRRPAWVTLPSLIQHLGTDDSVLNNNIPHERASDLYVGDMDIDPRDIDWSFDASDLPEVSGKDRINEFTQNFKVDKLIEDGLIKRSTVDDV